MCIHPDLDRARLTAATYRVRPSERGFNVWRFRDWSLNPGGWCIVVETKTREDGWLHVLHRLGLMSDKPPAPLPPAPAKVTVTDAEWF